MLMDGLLAKYFDSIGRNCVPIGTGRVDNFLKCFQDKFGGFAIRGNDVFGSVCDLDSSGIFDSNIDNFSQSDGT